MDIICKDRVCRCSRQSREQEESKTSVDVCMYSNTMQTNKRVYNKTSVNMYIYSNII